LEPNHQAEVELPVWTDLNVKSDSKWLETQVWPPSVKSGYGFLVEIDAVGKGRQDSCGCAVPVNVSEVCIGVFFFLTKSLYRSWTEKNGWKFFLLIIIENYIYI
jgi:hypothetical protein